MILSSRTVHLFNCSNKSLYVACKPCLEGDQPMDFEVSWGLYSFITLIFTFSSSGVHNLRSRPWVEFLFSLILIFDTSFNYECKQQTTIVLAPIEIRLFLNHITVPENTPSVIYTHHYFKLMLATRPAARPC